MQIPIVGQTYSHPSRSVNRQRCINLFPSVAGPGGRSNALLPTAGLKTLVDIGGNEVRAIIEADEQVYAVVDNKVYRLTIGVGIESATEAQIGTIDTSRGPVRWARNPTQIILVDGSEEGYIITLADDSFARIDDEDFLGGDTVVFIDSYFIVNRPGNITMQASASNDGTSWSALDFASAEGQPDKLLALAVDKRELWAFGTKSVEIWYNAANATGFILSRREGAFVDQGCAAKHSVVNIDNTMMWLDDRRYVVAVSNYSPTIITSPAISAEFQSYKVVEDAVAYQYADRGQLFYVITFPTEGKTWAYDLTTGQWHEKAFWNANNRFDEHLVRNCVKYKHKYLAGSRNDGRIFLYDDQTYTDGGQLIHRLRTTGHFNTGFNQIGVDSLEIKLETGKAPQSGSGSDPQIIMRYSNDGGYTWSYSLSRSIGKVGEYGKSIRWNRLGSGRQWMFEFTVAEPIRFAILDADVIISGGGN